MIFVSHMLLRPLAPRALGRCSRSFESPFLLHHPPLSPLEFTWCWEHSPRVIAATPGTCMLCPAQRPLGKHKSLLSLGTAACPCWGVHTRGAALI